jgi:hypothetical protein
MLEGWIARCTESVGIFRWDWYVGGLATFCVLEFLFIGMGFVEIWLLDWLEGIYENFLGTRRCLAHLHTDDGIAFSGQAKQWSIGHKVRHLSGTGTGTGTG